MGGLRGVQTEGCLACTVVVPTLGMSWRVRTLNPVLWVSQFPHLVYWIAQAVISKCHMWLASPIDICLSFYNSGGWKSKIKVSVTLVSPEASPWLWMAVFSLHPGLAFPLCAHIPGESLCVQSLLKRIVLRTTLMPHFNLITSLKALKVRKY